MGQTETRVPFFRRYSALFLDNLVISSGIKYWSGYDRDLAPEGETSEETQYNYEQVVDLIQEYQQKSGIRPLWIGIDFKNTYK